MDFTALELGLRNRQLLQVKCFLRIQIESKFVNHSNSMMVVVNLFVILLLFFQYDSISLFS